jgi:hypothetical protein
MGEEARLLEELQIKIDRQWSNYNMGLITPAETFQNVRDIVGQYKVMKIEIEQLQAAC